MKTVTVSSTNISRTFREKGSYNEIRAKYKESHPGCSIEIEPRIEFFPPVGLNDSSKSKYKGKLTYQKLMILVEYTDFEKEIADHLNFIHESELPYWTEKVYVFWNYELGCFDFDHRLSYTKTKMSNCVYIGRIKMDRLSKNSKPVFPFNQDFLKRQIENILYK